MYVKPGFPLAAATVDFFYGRHGSPARGFLVFIFVVNPVSSVNNPESSNSSRCEPLLRKEEKRNGNADGG